LYYTKAMLLKKNLLTQETNILLNLKHDNT
jgi:hypothetical protein